MIINKSLIKLISYEYFYKDSTQIFNYAEKDFELEFIKATPMPSPFAAKFRTKKWNVGRQKRLERVHATTERI